VAGPGRPRASADTHAEIESDSTLENVLRIKEDGYFGAASFAAADPLGLVSHEEHLPRINYSGPQGLRPLRRRDGEIAVPGPENYGCGLPESLLLPITRVAFLGVRGHRSLRGRHRMLVTWDRRLRRLP
jgi:hypothetical protein